MIRQVNADKHQKGLDRQKQLAAIDLRIVIDRLAISVLRHTYKLTRAFSCLAKNVV